MWITSKRYLGKSREKHQKNRRVAEKEEIENLGHHPGSCRSCFFTCTPRHDRNLNETCVSVSISGIRGNLFIKLNKKTEKPFAPFSWPVPSEERKSPRRCLLTSSRRPTSPFVCVRSLAVCFSPADWKSNICSRVTRRASQPAFSILGQLKISIRKMFRNGKVYCDAKNSLKHSSRPNKPGFNGF